MMGTYEEQIDKIRTYFEEHKAERYPFENQILSEKDEYVKSLYFRMLCTLIRYVGEPNQMQVLYINRLISGSHGESGFQDYMKMALDLRAEDIEEFISIFKENKLKYYFCIDGTILLAAAESTDKEYALLVEFVEMLGVTREELRYLVTLGRAIVAQSSEGVDEARKLMTDNTRGLSLYQYVKEFYRGTSADMLMGPIGCIAFDQKQLEELVDSGKKIIYLCGDKFEVSLTCPKVRYIGINNPVVVVKDTLTQTIYADNGILFEGVSLQIDDAYKDNCLPAHLLDVGSLRRDPFEYIHEYDKRINQMEKIYCGTAVLDKNNYCIETGKFEIEIAWTRYFLNILRDRIPRLGFFLNVDRDKAKKIYQSGACQPIYVLFGAINGNILLRRIFLCVQGEWIEVEYMAQNRSSEILRSARVTTGLGGYGISLI